MLKKYTFLNLSFYLLIFNFYNTSYIYPKTITQNVSNEINMLSSQEIEHYLLKHAYDNNLSLMDWLTLLENLKNENNSLSVAQAIQNLIPFDFYSAQKAFEKTIDKYEFLISSKDFEDENYPKPSFAMQYSYENDFKKENIKKDLLKANFVIFIILFENYKNLKFLIEKCGLKANKNAYILDYPDFSILHFCCSITKLNPDIYNILLKKIDPNKMKDNCLLGTSLHEAISNSNELAFLKLLEYGADVNFQNDTSQYPLHTAAKTGNPKIIQILLQKKATKFKKDNENKTPLDIAIESGQFDLIKDLNIPNEDINQKVINSLLTTGYYRWILQVDWHDASNYIYNETLINKLKSIQINLNTKNEHGETFLTTLINKSASISERLLEYFFEIQLDPTMSNDDGLNALHVAARGWNPELIKILIKHNYNIDAIEKNLLSTPLHQIFYLIKKNFINNPLFTEKLENLRYKDFYQKKFNNFDIYQDPFIAQTVEALLSNNANPNIKDIYGKTPLDYASQYNLKYTIDILLKYGAQKGDTFEEKPKFYITDLNTISFN